MENKQLLVMIDGDMDDYEIFKMAVDEISTLVECQFFPDCESAIEYFSKNTATPPGLCFH